MPISEKTLEKFKEYQIRYTTIPKEIREEIREEVAKKREEVKKHRGTFPEYSTALPLDAVLSCMVATLRTVNNLEELVKPSFPRYSGFRQLVKRMYDIHSSCMLAFTASGPFIQLLVTNGRFPAEVSWAIYKDGIEIMSGGPDTQIIISDLTAGDYTFQARDSFGDGWNGATFAIIANLGAEGVLANGTLASGFSEDFPFTITEGDLAEDPVELDEALNYSGRNDQIMWRLIRKGVNLDGTNRFKSKIIKSVKQTSAIYKKAQKFRLRNRWLYASLIEYADTLV